MGTILQLTKYQSSLRRQKDSRKKHEFILLEGKSRGDKRRERKLTTKRPWKRFLSLRRFFRSSESS